MWEDIKDWGKIIGTFLLVFLIISFGIWFEYQKIHACMQAFGLNWYQCMLLFGGGRK